MSDRWFVIRVNPEPWRVGPVSIGKRNGHIHGSVGRDQQLAAYQDAIRESLGEQQMIEGKVKVTLYFWRQQISYKTPTGRTVMKHYVDATNMQKATEDALQGVFFDNDSEVSDIRSIIVAQGPDVSPCVILRVEDYDPDTYLDIPDAVYAQKDHQPSLTDDNVWPPR